MNEKDLLNALGNIDDKIIEECNNSNFKKHNSNKIKLILIAAVIIILTGNSVLAIGRLKNENMGLYIHILTPDYLELEFDNDEIVSENEKYDKFFNALNSDNDYYKYIAINRLIEGYNDKEIKEKAIKEISKFMNYEEEKIADSAKFALDILTDSFTNENIYHLSDGSVIFTLFNNYSDFGSYSEIWQIKDGVLNSFWKYNDPSKYISKILVSEDKNLFAVETSSNKSSFLNIFDPINGYVSDELIGSSRVLYGQKTNKDVRIRLDSENYCSIEEFYWKDNNILSYKAVMTTDNYETHENIYGEYNFKTKELNIEILK